MCSYLARPKTWDAKTLTRLERPAHCVVLAKTRMSCRLAMAVWATIREEFLVFSRVRPKIKISQSKKDLTFGLLKDICFKGLKSAVVEILCWTIEWQCAYYNPLAHARWGSTSTKTFYISFIVRPCPQLGSGFPEKLKSNYKIILTILWQLCHSLSTSSVQLAIWFHDHHDR